jgi:hypothetical protein
MYHNKRNGRIFDEEFNEIKNYSHVEPNQLTMYLCEHQTIDSVREVKIVLNGRIGFVWLGALKKV